MSARSPSRGKCPIESHKASSAPIQRSSLPAGRIPLRRSAGDASPRLVAVADRGSTPRDTRVVALDAASCGSLAMTIAASYRACVNVPSGRDRSLDGSIP